MTNTCFLKSDLRHFRLSILRPSKLGISRFSFQHVARKKRETICISDPFCLKARVLVRKLVQKPSVREKQCVNTMGAIFMLLPFIFNASARSVRAENEFWRTETSSTQPDSTRIGKRARLEAAARGGSKRAKAQLEKGAAADPARDVPDIPGLVAESGRRPSAAAS